MHRLYRRRLIPAEFIALDDEIISSDAERIVTKWKTINPREDFTHGASCYFLNEGYKVSKFMKRDNTLRFYYCDIVKYEFDGAGLVVTDLLFDVVVEQGGAVKVLDLDEGAEALRRGLINQKDMCAALDSLDKLLKIIYSGKFKELLTYIDKI